MRIALLASALVLLTSAGHAGGLNDYGVMVQQHSPTCVKPVPRRSRVVFLAERMGPCCDGLPTCSQLLATTKIDPPVPASHT